MKPLQKYLINEAKDPFYKLTSDAQMCRHYQSIARKNQEKLYDEFRDELKQYIGKKLKVMYMKPTRKPGDFTVEEYTGILTGFDSDYDDLCLLFDNKPITDAMNIIGINEA